MIHVVKCNKRHINNIVYCLFYMQYLCACSKCICKMRLSRQEQKINSCLCQGNNELIISRVEQNVKEMWFCLWLAQIECKNCIFIRQMWCHKAFDDQCASTSFTTLSTWSGFSGQFFYYDCAFLYDEVFASRITPYWWWWWGG